MLDRMTLLMLEDDAERICRFGTVLRTLAPDLEMRLWRNAWRMIEEMEEFLVFVARAAARGPCLTRPARPLSRGTHVASRFPGGFRHGWPPGSPDPGLRDRW